jgi:hypothetical protein
VDIENCGYDYKGNQVYLTSTSLTYPMNPGHDHASWLNQWDNNKMDGTCRNPPSGGYTTDQCFAYVPRSGNVGTDGTYPGFLTPTRREKNW